MIQVDQGSWQIPIAPQGAVEHTYTSRKLDLNVAYAIEVKALTFPVKKGQDPNNPHAERVAKASVVVLEPGFEGIERDVNMGLPKPIPQGITDERQLRSLLFPHEQWYNLLLSIGYNEQLAKQIVAQGGITAAVIANAPNRGRAYMMVEEDEYASVVKDPVTKQPVIDPTTGAPRTEQKIGENRSFCSPAVHQKQSAAAARAKTVGGNPAAHSQQPGFGGPSFQPPAGFGAPSGPAPAVPQGGFAAPSGPAVGGNPFVGAPNGGVPAGPMASLMQPRA